MATSPLLSDLLIANPTLNANPRRYGAQDVPSINRVVQQVRFFLPWRSIQGQVLDIRGHLASSRGPEAAFFDHFAVSSQLEAISATDPYIFAEGGVNVGPSQEIALKEINARFDMRVLTQRLLSRQFNQVRFQKAALRHAICARLEFGLINGDADNNPAEFDGLKRLVDRGLGQRLTAPQNAKLNILDQAITMVRAHNRRCDLIVMNQEAWRRVLALLRSRGVRPSFRRSRRMRRLVLTFDGVPICLSDHIETRLSGQRRLSSVFFLSLGRPNGVFGIVNRRARRIHFTKTSRQDEPFESYQAHLYCAIASTTSDALVELADWDVSAIAD